MDVTDALDPSRRADSSAEAARRLATPDEAMEWITQATARLLLDRYPERPRGWEMWLAVLTLLPELQAMGIHAQWTPDQSGLQFSAFQPLADLKAFWGYVGSDGDFEALLRGTDGVNLLTLDIGGTQTRVAEPFIPVEAPC